jgi:hypothetical protein
MLIDLTCAVEQQTRLNEAGEDEFSVRLAAKAANREKAARQEWPAFQERLRELGYGPRAIAHAFRSLSGPAPWPRHSRCSRGRHRPNRIPSLRFDVTETRGGHSAPNAVTITSGERDDVRIASTTTSIRRLISVLTDVVAVIVALGGSKFQADWALRSGRSWRGESEVAFDVGGGDGVGVVGCGSEDQHLGVGVVEDPEEVAAR